MSLPESPAAISVFSSPLRAARATRSSTARVHPAAPQGKQLLLLRHGATALNSTHRFVGASDPGLTPLGRRQLKAAARSLSRYQPQRCFCSPLRRCLETADTVLSGTGLQTEILPDLREINFGEWEGKTFDEICATEPARIEGWAGFDASFCFPGGEALGDFARRVQRAALHIAACPEKQILVVTHGGVIRLLICQLLRLPIRNYVLFEPGPGSLTVINLFESGRGTLAALIPCGSR